MIINKELIDHYLDEKDIKNVEVFDIFKEQHFKIPFDKDVMISRIDDILKKDSFYNNFVITKIEKDKENLKLNLIPYLTSA